MVLVAGTNADIDEKVNKTSPFFFFLLELNQ